MSIFHFVYREMSVYPIHILCLSGVVYQNNSSHTEHSPKHIHHQHPQPYACSCQVTATQISAALTCVTPHVWYDLTGISRRAPGPRAPGSWHSLCQGTLAGSTPPAAPYGHRDRVTLYTKTHTHKFRKEHCDSLSVNSRGEQGQLCHWASGRRPNFLCPSVSLEWTFAACVSSTQFTYTQCGPIKRRRTQTLLVEFNTYARRPDSLFPWAPPDPFGFDLSAGGVTGGLSSYHLSSRKGLDAPGEIEDENAVEGEK